MDSSCSSSIGRLGVVFWSGVGKLWTHRRQRSWRWNESQNVCQVTVCSMTKVSPLCISVLCELKVGGINEHVYLFFQRVKSVVDESVLRGLQGGHVDVEGGSLNITISISKSPSESQIPASDPSEMS